MGWEGGGNRAIDVQKFRCSTSTGRFCIRSPVATQLSEWTDPAFVREERRNGNCVVPDHTSMSRLVRGRGGGDVQECLDKVNASGVPYRVVLGPPLFQWQSTLRTCSPGDEMSRMKDV